MEVTLDKLLGGKSTRINSKDFVSTEDYVKPCIEVMSKFTSTYRIEAKDPTKRWSKCVMMLNYLQNRFKTEYLSKVGRNAKVKFIKGIVDEYNASLNALTPDYLAGGEIIFDTAKNPPSSIHSA